MTDVSIPAAFGAGLISFVSPCVLPLAAPYLCYLAGASVEALVDEGEAKARRDILVTALLFVAGFTTVFVAFGATASAFGALFRQWSHALSILAGIGVILMGLHFLGVLRIGAMLREARLEDRTAGRRLERLSDGHGLRARLDALHRADSRDHSRRRRHARNGRERRGLLAVYSLGLGVPFILAAAAMGPFMRASRFVKAQFGRIEKTVGVLLVATGVAFLTGGFQSASLWLIETFPQFGQVG